jgi:hypothetical protein
MFQIAFRRVEISVQAQRGHLLEKIEALLMRPNPAVKAFDHTAEKIRLEHRAGLR